MRDVTRSVTWYQDVLGLERRYANVWGDFPAVPGVGTTSLALFPAPVPEPRTRTYYKVKAWVNERQAARRATRFERGIRWRPRHAEPLAT